MPNKSKHNKKPALLTLILPRAGILAVLCLAFVVIVRGSDYSFSFMDIEPTIEEEEILPEEETEVTVAPDATATIAVAGDIMMHSNVSTAAYDSETDTYDFAKFFTYAGTWLQDADLAIANLEGTMAGKVNGYPAFSTSDDLAASLVTLGVDLLSTANNHCADYSAAGIIRTIQVLDEYGIDHVGTYASQEAFDENMGIVVEEVNGITIAFLDYTYGVNYITLSDDYLVNRYNTNTDYEEEKYTILDTEKLDTEMAYARSLNTDLIVVLIHWGTEYSTSKSEYQEEIADYLIQRGADAVLGSHSHVPQSLEKRTVVDIDGNLRSGFVCYSLGNLISDMRAANTYYTAILNLEITRTDGKTSITGISYEPMYLLNPNNSGLDTLVLLDIPAVLEDYDNGIENPYVTEELYEKLVTAAETMKKLFGSSWSISYDLVKAAEEEAAAQEELTDEEESEEISADVESDESEADQDAAA